MDKKLQYTITILPGFLVPYSNIPIDKIFYAFTEYIAGRAKTYYEAALLLYCLSRHTFRLYYLRVINKIIPWTNFFLSRNKKIEESESLPVKTVKERWGTLVLFMKEESYPGSEKFPLASAHILFCSNRMGLGP